MALNPEAIVVGDYLAAGWDLVGDVVWSVLRSRVPSYYLAGVRIFPSEHAADSSLLGAVGGVLIADYFLIRRTRLDQAGLYRRAGPYWYSSGFNSVALLALVAGIAPCVPGFLGETGIVRVPVFWVELYHFAWFLSFGVAFVVYALLMSVFHTGSRSDS